MLLWRGLRAETHTHREREREREERERETSFQVVLRWMKMAVTFEDMVQY